MLENDRLILVIDESDARADGLKDLIEFMDAPEVSTATPANWQSRMGSQRLAAIFLSDGLPEKQISGLLTNLGKIDPNVPVVLINGQQNA